MLQAMRERAQRESGWGVRPAFAKATARSRRSALRGGGRGEAPRLTNDDLFDPPAVRATTQAECPAAIGRARAPTNPRLPTRLADAACTANVADDGDVAETERHLLRDQPAERAAECLTIDARVDSAGGGRVETVVRRLVARQHRANQRLFGLRRWTGRWTSGFGRSFERRCRRGRGG